MPSRPFTEDAGMESLHAQASRWQGELLPRMVDHLARDKPDAVYGLWPVSPSSYDEGFLTITYAQLANIVNGLAQLLLRQLGSGDGQVLTYVGPNDVRLTALLLASIKAGYGLFLTSPRNSAAAHRSLFGALKCHTLVTTDPSPPSAQAIIEAVKPYVLVVPSILELLAQENPPVTYEKHLQDALRDPLMIIHTSGSTGLPKPLIWTQDSGARHHACSSRGGDALQDATSLDSLLVGKRVMVTVPPFHGAGLGQYLLWAIPFGSIPIAPAATGIVTAQGLVDSLKRTPAQIAVLVPSVVAELAQNPDLLDYCARHLELILYIGGDLPQAVGDLVAEKIQLHCWWGASECGIPHQLIPRGLGSTQGDWRYIRFHPSVGAVFDPITEDTYELVMRHDDTLPQTCFSIRGQEHVTEYRTKDIFTRHPTVEDAWCWRARADDIIVFLNGEKTNPVSMEQHVVASNPELGGALVIGAQRFQAALLIEPDAATQQPLTTAQQAALIEKIWPSVEEANNSAPAHARVEKALILVATPDRPFMRAGKGTIQRGATIAQYAVEIEVLYANADVQMDEISSAQQVASQDPSAVARFVRETISAMTGWTDADGESTSFFDRGMDSLQALQLTRALRRGLHRADLGLSTVYDNPTVAKLTAAISAPPQDGDADRRLMEPLLKTYKDLVSQISRPVLSEPTRQPEKLDVLLTGSTGSIGTFLLRALLDRPGIGHVFCLNRGEDGGRAAQLRRFDAAGLAKDDLGNRVTFLKAVLASPHLGLNDADYETLRTRVGLIIHNAWPVNFNLGLSAFRPQLAGLVNLFSLASAAASTQIPHLLFISSVSAVGGLPADADPAPEKFLSSMEAPYPRGYARSKFLSELLCDAASQHLGLPVTIARVGQVAGAVRRNGGIWNRAEWLPSLVISSVLRLGCLPATLGGQFTEIDWVPSDLLAEVVVDLGTRDGAKGARVFNVRNPRTTTWESLLPAVVDAAKVSCGRTPDVVTSLEWLNRLSDSEHESSEEGAGDEVEVNPALKLASFYRYVLWSQHEPDAPSSTVKPMNIENALLSSQTLRDTPAVSQDWMHKWVTEWVTNGRSDETGKGRTEVGKQ